MPPRGSALNTCAVCSTAPHNAGAVPLRSSASFRPWPAPSIDPSVFHLVDVAMFTPGSPARCRWTEFQSPVLEPFAPRLQHRLARETTYLFGTVFCCFFSFLRLERFTPFLAQVPRCCAQLRGIPEIWVVRSGQAPAGGSDAGWALCLFNESSPRRVDGDHSGWEFSCSRFKERSIAIAGIATDVMFCQEEAFFFLLHLTKQNKTSFIFNFFFLRYTLSMLSK